MKRARGRKAHTSDENLHLSGFRASQYDGWLATVSDAPLPLHFIGGASVAHFEFGGRRCSPERFAVVGFAAEEK
ncbi:hypothetical protein EVAR_91573_1 [Eumeta japonica]|uniref:Uncharacterized protein n=1 Tax=Eumeta variegata TaxID=151549 RepID=A0A4C1X906_EUMVA|nr:hypothetical protein EVAR_91573_1 [Eumeta japonica]